MSYFANAEFGSKIDPTCQEHRGNKQLIALMKADIKAFTETTRRESIAWRTFHREIAKGLTTWEKRPAWRTTNRTLMRHIFLAYGYLRFKPWEKIEPKTVEVRIDGDCYFNKRYYTGGPRQDLICDIIKHYVQKLQAVESATT